MFILINLTQPEYERPEMTKIGVYATKADAQRVMRTMFDADVKLAKADEWYDEDYAGINDTMAWVNGELFTDQYEIFEAKE